MEKLMQALEITNTTPTQRAITECLRKGFITHFYKSSIFFVVKLVLHYENPNSESSYQGELTQERSSYPCTNLENKTQQHENKKNFMKVQVPIITFLIFLKNLLATNKQELDYYLKEDYLQTKNKC